MSLLQRTFRSLPLTRQVSFAGIMILAVGLSACGGGRLTTDRAYGELKPKEQLPEREMSKLPDNLFIQIKNVADAGKSFKNFVVLYVNGREVSPVEKINNFSSTYTYPMRVQHGLYEIRAEYHVVGFWREKAYELKPDEVVKVLPDQRTVLTAVIEKDHRGRPIKNRSRFRTRFESLNPNAPEHRVTTAPRFAPAASKQVQRPITVQRAPALEEQVVADSKARPLIAQPRVTKSPTTTLTKQVPQPELIIEQPEVDLTDIVMLQINTSPPGADIIIDDRYYGQSPLKIRVSANQNHVLQVSRNGYGEYMKILDVTELLDQQLLQLLIKLDPVEQKNDEN